jgi:ankyrin repeat protein
MSEAFMCARIMNHVLLLAGVLLCSMSAAFSDEVHRAVVKGDLQLLTSLINEDSQLLNVRDANGKTPLNLAVELKFREMSESLIMWGADVNLSDQENHSPLHNAAASGDMFIVRLLLKNGASTINDTTRLQGNILVGRWTPLHLACLNGHPEIVEVLLDHGADIESRDGVQRTPLILTAESKSLRVAEVLIDRGAEINAVAIRGYTALLWGARNEFEEYVDLLIAREALIATESLPQAFQWAVLGGMEGLLEYAVERGCNVEEFKQREPDLILLAAAGGSAEIVKLLVRYGFEPTQLDQDGWTTLQYATSAGHANVIEYLLGLGLDINARNLKGESAFNLATLKGFNEIAESLKTSGADTSVPLFPILEGPYMGQPPPGDTPVLFLRGIVSGHDRAHSSITFSPDGLEAYWTEMIPPEGRVAFTHAVASKWTYPVAAGIDRDPTFSPDGNRLYFIKTRPFKNGEVPGGDPDLKEEYWYMERTNTGWSSPTSVGEEVNAIGVHWPCSVDGERNLYFSEFSDNMYCSRYVDGAYETPILLTEYFNNVTLVGRSPFIMPDRGYLLFSANDSLNISFRREDGTWMDRINLGNDINASHVNGSPRITADGKYMFFVSAGQGRPWGIYWVSTGFIDRLRSEHLSDR